MSHLATPHERPGSSVVVFDGNCRFCRQQVERLARWDRQGALSFVSLHDDWAAEHLPDLTHEQLMEQMYVVLPDQRRYAGAAAFRYLSRRLPRLWPLAPLLHIPFSLPLWQWGYRQVAKRRYALAGKTEACEGDACRVHFR